MFIVDSGKRLFPIMTNISLSPECISMIDKPLVEKKLRKIEDFLREMGTISIDQPRVYTDELKENNRFYIVI